MFRGCLSLSVIVFSCAFSAPVLAAADSSSPKATVKSFYDLLAAGDIDGAMKLFATPANDKEKQLFDEGMSDDAYAPALMAALNAKFPDANISKADKMVAFLKESADKMTEKIEGDTATLTMPAGPGGTGGGPVSQPITLKKIDGAWKIAIVEGRFLRLPPEQFRGMIKAKKQGILDLIAEVKAGKYATADEAKAAMNKKQEEIGKKFAPAGGNTSGPPNGPRPTPATAPANQNAPPHP